MAQCWGWNSGSLWFQNLSFQSLCDPATWAKPVLIQPWCQLSWNTYPIRLSTVLSSVSVGALLPCEASFTAQGSVRIAPPWGFLCYCPYYIVLSRLCACVSVYHCWLFFIVCPQKGWLTKFLSCMPYSLSHLPPSKNHPVYISCTWYPQAGSE